MKIFTKFFIKFYSIPAILILLFVLFLSQIPNTSHSANSDELKFEDRGCYEWVLSYKGDKNGGIVVHTSEFLLHDKEKEAKSKQMVEKNCNNLGKSVYGRLRDGVKEISQIRVFPRGLVVFKYPYPKDWEPVKKEIIKTLDEVLCGGKKAKRGLPRSLIGIVPSPAAGAGGGKKK